MNTDTPRHLAAELRRRADELHTRFICHQPGSDKKVRVDNAVLSMCRAADFLDKLTSRDEPDNPKRSDGGFDILINSIAPFKRSYSPDQHPLKP